MKILNNVDLAFIRAERKEIDVKEYIKTGFIANFNYQLAVAFNSGEKSFVLSMNKDFFDEVGKELLDDTGFRLEHDKETEEVFTNAVILNVYIED